MEVSRKGGWLQILIVYLFGILAGAMVLRPVPLEADLVANFGFSQLQFSFFLGIAGLPAAILATASGLMVDRFGPRFALVSAAGAAILLDLGYLVAPNLYALFALRFLEGLVIITTLNAGPAILIAMSSEKSQKTALSLWSSYTPVGNFIALAVGGVVAGGLWWTMAYAYHIALLAVAVGLTWFSLPHVDLREKGQTGPRKSMVETFAALRQPGPIRLAIIFFAIASLGVGSTTVLPAYIASEHGLSINQASGLMAGANLMMLIGTFLAGLAVARGIGLMLLALVLGGIGAALGVATFLPNIHLSLLAPLLGGWFAGIGGGKVLMTVLLPIATPPGQRGLAIGVVNQASALASFGAPVIWKLLATGSNWLVFAGMITVSWLVVVVLVRQILRAN